MIFTKIIFYLMMAGLIGILAYALILEINNLQKNK